MVVSAWTRSTVRHYAIYLADLDRRSTDSHGVMNYALNLVTHLPPQLSQDERLSVYINESLLSELPVVDAQIRVLPFSRRRAQRLWNDNVSLWRARRDEVDVMHYPKGYLPFRVRRSPAVVATLHDDIVLQYASGRWRHPEPGKLMYFAWATKHSLRAADVILTDSAFSKGQLQEWGRQFGRDLEPRVTRIGTTAQEVGATSSDEPFFLVFGSRFPHKRSHEAVAFLLRYLDESGRREKVIVVGSAPEVIDTRVIRVEGGMSSADLSELICSAVGVVGCSEYEGFGLLPLDAHSVGTPAAFALNDAARELFSWLPGGFEIGSYDSFKRAMGRLSELDRRSLSDLAESSHVLFSWEDVSSTVLTAYRSASGAAV